MRAGGIGPGPWERGRAAAGGIGTGRVSTAGPRGKEGAQSGRDSDVRNVETPARVQALPGRPTVRRAELPGGNRMPKKRTPAAERQRETLGGISGPSAGRPGITGRISALAAGPVTGLTWAGGPLNADAGGRRNRRAS